MRKNIKKFLLLTLALSSYHIAAAQNQAGYVSLFNGKTLKGWKRFDNIANYNVSNGVIVAIVGADGGNRYLATEKDYGNFVLQLDVKTEGESINSGIQVGGQLVTIGYATVITGKQCEIDPTSRKWTGGIYNTWGRGWLYPLDLNAKAKNAFKPGVYNHIKIECIGKETKTWVNGVATAYLIDTISNSGFIGLQVNGKGSEMAIGQKVYFKNIKIKTKNLNPQPFPKGVYVVNYASNTLTDYETNDGWKLLFDGKTATGWHSAGKTTFPQKGWIVGNGLMTVDPQVKDQPSGGDILTTDQYSAFDLSFEFLTTPVANSGVKYFVTVDEKNAPLGLEYQVLDDLLHPDAKLGSNGDRTESSLYDLIPRNIPGGMSFIVKPVGEWNTGRIVVYPNNHVEHYLNGVKVLEYDRLSPEFKALIAISKYQHYNGFGIGPKGYILLQDHGCVVSFRSIKIKTLQ
jgi:hypothetical protein